MKIVKLAGAVIAAIVLVVAAFVLTVGIPAKIVMTPAIQARIERATGHRVAIGGATRIGLWPTFHVTLNDITLNQRASTDSAERIEIAQARAEMPLAQLISGKPIITDLKLEKPVAYLPLLRERTTSKAAPINSDATTSGTAQVRIDRVTITDGALVFANTHDKVEEQIEAINATAAIGADLQLVMNATAQSGGHPLKLDLRAELPVDEATRHNMSMELTFEAPSLMSETLTAKADVRVAGTIIRMNGVSGAFGGKPFAGWASVDLASKPLVKLDLDIQDLAIGKPEQTATQASAPWSDTPFDLRGLNYVDAEMRISAARLAYGDLRIAPLAFGATLDRGTLTAKVENLGIYDGLANGALTLDASDATPRLSAQGDLAGIRARPLLSGLAGFDRLEGKLQGKFAVRSSGSNPRAMMSNLEGTAFLDFRDGKIRGINVAQMIRSLTAHMLNGWQADDVQATDLSQLSASFRIAQGEAETNDLALTGPLVRMRGAGTVDLGGKALALRVEPKLVMSLEGQGGTADPVGLGIPVAIQGPWAEPRIYPDMAGILDNPDAAYAKLRELGQGLFGTAPDQPEDSDNDGASAITSILKQLFGR